MQRGSRRGSGIRSRRCISLVDRYSGGRSYLQCLDLGTLDNYDLKRRWSLRVVLYGKAFDRRIADEHEDAIPSMLRDRCSLGWSGRGLRMGDESHCRMLFVDTT